jgi:uncharacterized protein (DUF1330 family)
MRTTDMTLENIQAAAGAIPADAPVFMLNMLRYRERAEYAGADAPPCSGREAYHERYRPAFGRVAEGAGVKVAWLGGVLAKLVAPAGELWDDVAIVEYPSFAAFRRVVENPRYEAEAAPHRKAALADWRLIATAKML